MIAVDVSLDPAVHADPRDRRRSRARCRASSRRCPTSRSTSCSASRCSSTSTTRRPRSRSSAGCSRPGGRCLLNVPNWLGKRVPRALGVPARAEPGRGDGRPPPLLRPEGPLAAPRAGRLPAPQHPVLPPQARAQHVRGLPGAGGERASVTGVGSRFFIVGGAGFIGSHFAEHLLGDPGHDRGRRSSTTSRPGREWHLDASPATIRGSPIVRGDVKDLDALDRGDARSRRRDPPRVEPRHRPGRDRADDRLRRGDAAHPARRRGDAGQRRRADPLRVGQRRLRGPR